MILQRINQKIKEIYGSKASFCTKNEHKYKDFASKLRTFQNRIDWINKFIKPLDLKIYLDDEDRTN